MKGPRPRGGRQARALSTPPNRVPFFPGRGTRYYCQDARVFYATKVRAASCFWRHMGASRQVLDWIQRGVKFNWKDGKPPKPFSQRPRMVPEQHCKWLLDKLQEGLTTGAHGPLPSRRGRADARWLSPAHVTVSAGKPRLVVAYTQLNDACEAAACRYETIDHLVDILTPQSWLLSADLSAAYHHCAIAQSHRKYTGFHFALPYRCGNEVLPLQTGGYYVYPPQSRPQTSSPDSRTLASPPDPLYQVVELCAYSLNFGARASPLVFTKHMRTLVKYLRRHAIGVVIYLDDLAFVIEGSQEAAHRARDFIDRTITKAGLHRHPTKGQFLLASQVLHDHLGFRVDIPANLLSIPERRCNKVRQLAIALKCNSARNRRLVDTKLLQQFCGVACSMTRAVPAARLHLRSLYDCTSLHRPCSRLNRTALQDLTFWTQITGTHPDNGVPLFQSPTSKVLYTDASGGIGWGGVLPTEHAQRELCRARSQYPHADALELHLAAGIPCPAYLHRDSNTCAGYWDTDLMDLHVTWKELRAFHRAIRVWGQRLSNARVLLFCDNQAVCSLLRHGTSRSPLLMAELRVVWQLLVELRITIDPVYIRSEDNPADLPSRQRDTSDWTFRPGTRAHLRALWPHAFTLDPFATARTTMGLTWCSLRDEEEATAADGFATSWSNETVFLNPPWRDMARVIRKIFADRTRGVLVIPRWPSQHWWPLALQLRASWHRLPPPRHCVLALHRGRTDPFAQPTTRLVALAFDASNGPKRGKPTWRKHY